MWEDAPDLPPRSPEPSAGLEDRSLPELLHSQLPTRSWLLGAMTLGVKWGETPFILSVWVKPRDETRLMQAVATGHARRPSQEWQLITSGPGDRILRERDRGAGTAGLSVTHSTLEAPSEFVWGAGAFGWEGTGIRS